MEINKYKADKRITEHLSSLSFGGGEQNNNHGVVMFKYTDGRFVDINYNFEPHKFYKCTLQGKYGYSSGKALAFVHPDIKYPVAIRVSTGESIQDTQYSSMERCVYGYEFFAESDYLWKGDDRYVYFIAGDSVDSLERMDKTVMYEPYGFEELDDKDVLLDPFAYGSNRLGFKYFFIQFNE